MIILHIAGGDEPDISVWVNEVSAAKQACALMAQTIDNEWDFGDAKAVKDATELKRLITSGSYLDAVNYWNDCDTVMDSCYSYTYWIEDRRINALCDAEEPQEILNIPYCSPSGLPPVLQVPLTKGSPQDLLGLPSLKNCGATCRQCGNPNEYATPDKADGTYVCRSCKGMNEIFGAK